MLEGMLEKKKHSKLLKINWQNIFSNLHSSYRQFKVTPEIDLNTRFRLEEQEEEEEEEEEEEAVKIRRSK